jgi:hypothetical protein
VEVFVGEFKTTAVPVAEAVGEEVSVHEGLEVGLAEGVEV